MATITSKTTPTAKAAAHNAAMLAAKGASNKMKLITPEQQAEYVASLAAASAVPKEVQVLAPDEIAFICTSLKNHAEALNDADKILFPALMDAGHSIDPMEQTGKVFKHLKEQLRLGMVAGGKYTDESARTIAPKIGKVILYASHGWIALEKDKDGFWPVNDLGVPVAGFRTRNYNHAYAECGEAVVNFWTPKKPATKKIIAKTAPTLKELQQNIRESGQFIASHTSEFMKSLPHAVQIRAAIETLKLLKIPVPRVLSKMVEA